MPGKSSFFGQKSSYKLSDIKKKISDNEVYITENARQSALDDFGWELEDIKDVFSKLQPVHFYKTAQSEAKYPIWLDFYKAHISGEDIYTHFYVDDDNKYLVINSFKRDHKGLKQ